MENALVNQQYQLQKMPMKGGWTFVELPNLPKELKQRFGWIPVKGMIDTYEIKQFKLWGMANGNMFMPVKAEIRKKIKKGEGDWVHITLYYDDTPLEIPEEFLVCLMDSPLAHKTFFSFAETSQKHYVDWIFESKTLETKVNRIAKAIEKLEKGLKLYQSLEEDV